MSDVSSMREGVTTNILPSEDEVRGYFSSLSNWDRWGHDDRRGTLNHITPQARQRAAAEVREGITVSCAWDIRPNRPSPNTAFGVPQRYMAVTCDESSDGSRRGAMAAEWFGMLYHGLDVTHLDALSHMAWDGHFYNGVPASTLTPASGARELAVTEAADGIVGRGVLVDITAIDGRNWLEPGEPVTRKLVEQACDRQRVTVEPGDIVLLHTGFAERRRTLGWQQPIQPEGYPGWHASTLPWLHERQVAMIGSDSATDVQPSGYPSLPTPVHYIGLVAMGLWLLDNCDFTDLVALCRRLDRWTFLAMVSGLRLRGGTGSPANPIALF